MGPILWGEGRTKDGHSLFQSDQGIFLEAYSRFSRFEKIRYHNDSSVVMKIMMRLLMLKMLIMMEMMVFMMMMNMTLCSSLV